MGGGRGIRVWASGMLAIAGGVLMVASGYASRGLLLTALGFVESDLGRYLGGIEGLTVGIAIDIVVFLIALGGVTVVFGGLTLLLRHRTIGRLLIMLGGGAGFLGLAVTFGFAAFRLGLSGALAYADYWVGLVLAIIARRVAKGI